ncbi:hypothetical protein E2C01_057384 [Portunus trituberculatus]|uniref:Uncharacterized protein n=1 Tax=Portunus trituberculatus TaxID=210409 RepID=A0A5B7H286_PORTR|nr:hypothetical protein [Portunus trituberculatus]
MQSCTVSCNVGFCKARSREFTCVRVVWLSRITETRNTYRHSTQCAHVLATTVRVHDSSSAGGDEANTEERGIAAGLYRRAGARVFPGGGGG